MRVKNRMTPNPIVATLKTTYSEAVRLMKQNEIRHLPIVDAKGVPAGMVTESDLNRAGPSNVTTLNVFEIASYLDNITMEDVMSSPVYAVDEACSITNAASFMMAQRIDSLLVMRGDELVGIISIANIFKAFIEMTGGNQPGSRIEARLPNQKGHLAPFIQALSNAGSYIVSLALSSNETDFGYWDIKERGGSEDSIREELDRLGYAEVLSFRQSESDTLLTFGKVGAPKL